MTCDEDQDVKEEKSRSKKPSALSLSIGSIIGVLSLAASGVASYVNLQSDIASLKRDVVYQERVNERFTKDLENIREEGRAGRNEQRETMGDFNAKLDRIIENWSRRR